MTNRIAVAYFLTQQEKHIVALDEYDDPAIQYIYRMAHHIFTEDSNNKVIQDTNTESFCDTTIAQYEKIIKNNDSVDLTARKRITKYAQDGIAFTTNFKRYCTRQESIPVTPMQVTKSKGLLFVEKFIAQNKGE
ncbi:hypothetical protein DFQ28_006333 [Apophysomyces sp. BC1034]|nr:hypothetical protein DFQ30_009123 [Apophysomyces sp. BC1015]KAG0181255.1 hypothetical protein DFQ29_008864 [Apophysomyces sp. BC1021]KAG0193110.1 hypothetical protein DFQ28_006333 [Apophysomyces sp. BC1034]